MSRFRVYPERRQPMALRHSQGSSQIEVDFISGDATIAVRTPYVVAMMATPSKEPKANYRHIHVSGWPKSKDQGGEFIRIRGWEHERPDFYWKRWILMTGLQNPVRAKATVAAFLDRGVKSIPYNCGAMMPDSNSIYDYYGNDWRRSVNGKLQPKAEFMTDIDGTKFNGAVPVCANNVNFADYMVYYMDKYLAEYNVCGLYLDYGGVNPSDKPYTDTSLTDVIDPLKTVKAYNTFGVRDLYERLRKTMQRRDAGNVLWIHEWDRYHPAIVSFADMIYPGEEFMHAIRSNLRTYGEETSLPAWQAAYNSNVYGAAVQFLNQYRYYTDIVRNNSKTNAEKLRFARDLVTMTLLHDIPMSDYFMEDIYFLFDTNRIMDAQFRTYYTDGVIKSGNDNVKASYYQWKDRKELLLVIGNVSSRRQEFAIDFGCFAVEGEGVDALSKEKVDLTSRLGLDDFESKLIWVKLK